MKRNINDLLKVDDLVKNDDPNTSDVPNDTHITKKTKLIKKDGFVEFTVRYYEFKRLMNLFSFFGKSVKIICNNLNVSFTLSDVINLNEQSVSNYPIFTTKKHRKKKSTTLEMTSLIQFDESNNFKSNLEENEIYKATLNLSSIITSLNSLNFTIHSNIHFKFFFNDTNPKVNFTHEISVDHTFMTSFTHLQKTTSSPNPSNSSPDNQDPLKILDVNQKKLLFSLKIKTLDIFNILKLLDDNVEKIDISCDYEKIIFEWKSDKNEYKYLLKYDQDNNFTANNISDETNETNETNQSDKKIVSKKFNIFVLHNLVRRLLPLSTHVNFNFFSDNIFIFSSEIADVSKLMIKI